MSDNFTGIGTKRVVSEEPVTYKIWQISIEAGDRDNLPSVIVLLRAQDAQGVWDPNIEPKRFQFTDEPVGTPNRKRQGTILQDIILGASTADTAPARNLGTVGQPILRSIRAALKKFSDWGNG